MLHVVSSSDNAILATSSTTIFWVLGIYTNSTLSNPWVRWFVNLRFFCILSSFASYSPLICPITSFELFWTNRFWAPSTFPSLSSISIPSYSASLLVAKNFSWTLYLSTSPSRVAMTTPYSLLLLGWRTIGMYHPSFGFVGETVLVRKGELGDEVHQSLCLNGCSGMVLSVKLANFNCPLNHSFSCLRFVHGLFDRLVRHR